jgi:hypothetical protein
MTTAQQRHVLGDGRQPMKCPRCSSENRTGARFCRECGHPLPSQAQPQPSEAGAPTPHVHIEGNVSGHVAVGNNILQIGDVSGGVVNVMMPGQEIRPRPRPTPVDLRPRPFPGFLDRVSETETATTALKSGAPIEFRALAGMGKTSLLRHLAHHPTAAAIPDGVVYLSARRQPLDDLLQSLHDAFCESDVPFKPTETQLKHALQHKQALVIVDDLELAREETETLLDAAPKCTFVLASHDRRLWGEGKSIALVGLPLDDGLELVERELGRPLTADEQTTARGLHVAAQGHPLTLIQAAAKARESKRPLHETVVAGATPSAVATASELPDQARQLVATLAAMGGAPVHTDHLAALSGLPDVTSALQTLSTRRLAQAHSPQYSLTGGLSQALQQTWDLTPWREQALAHFTKWAREQNAPELVLRDADAILYVLEWAAAAGHWRSVLRLGGAVERALALGGRWAAWVKVLGWMHQAALALNDKAAEAWALHQLGTRSLCLGKDAAARASLERALRLREALGDLVGVEVTKHNLELLAAAPPIPPEKPRPPKPGPQLLSWPLLVIGVGAIVALVAAIVIVSIVAPHIIPIPEEPTATPTATAVPTQTPTQSPTEEPIQEIEAPTLLEPPDGYEMACPGESQSSIQLYWYPAEGAESLAYYEVEVTRHPAYPPTPETWTVEAEAEETEIEGECGDSFEWRVRLVDEEGRTSAWSETWDLRILTLNESDTEGPSAPGPLDPGTRFESSPEFIACDQVILTWKASSDNAGGSGVMDYRVNLQGFGVGWESIPPYSLVTGTSMEVTKYLSPSVARYRWKVWARDRAGNIGDESDWLYFECDSTAPPMPEVYEPGDDSEHPESSYCPWTLVWEEVSDPSGVEYEVVMEQREGDEPWEDKDRIDGLSSATVTISTCEPYKTYRWRVRAIDGAGNTSGWSEWLYVTTIG